MYTCKKTTQRFKVSSGRCSFSVFSETQIEKLQLKVIDTVSSSSEVVTVYTRICNTEVTRK